MSTLKLIEGEKYLSKTGEAMQVEFKDGKPVFRLFDSDFVLEGPEMNIPGLFEVTGTVKISEEEWMRRVVAMRFFQSEKHNDDYPHSTYLGQYEEMKCLPDSTIKSFYEIGGK